MRPLLYKLLWFFFLTASPLSGLFGQRILPLQQHKILWADTVYREASLKKDSALFAEAYYLYGKAYEAAGDLLTAKQFYLKALAIIEPRGSSRQLAKLYRRMAHFASYANYPETKRYSYLMLKVAQEIKSDQFLESAYGNLLFLYSKDWSQNGKFPHLPRPDNDSIAYYKPIVNKISSKRIADTLSHTQDDLYLLQMKIHDANMLHEKGKFAASIAQFQSAIQLASKINRKTMLIDAMVGLANIYIETKQFRLAQPILQQAEQMYNESAFRDSYVSKHTLLTAYKHYFETLNDWQQAYIYTEKLRELESLNYKADREGAVSRLQIEYETEKKELLLKAREEELMLRAKNARINRWFNSLLISLLVVAAGITAFFYKLYRKNRRISQQNEVLIREQNHRVKNNLQSISSLLSLQSHELQDSRALDVINESRQRVESMAILHRKLYKDHHAGFAFLPDFLEEIAENVLNSYGLSTVELMTDVEPLYLAADKAVALGLVLNELITNSCKYAFPSHSEPALQIVCKRTTAQEIYLEVADNGDREYSPATGKGFGMQLIEMEVEQLYGRYHFAFHNGTFFTMTFPEKTPETIKL